MCNQGKDCGGKRKDKITELFPIALLPPACTASPGCGNITVHDDSCKIGKCNKSPGYLPADKHPEPLDNPYF